MFESPQSAMRLYDAYDQRLYLNRSELDRFLLVAKQAQPLVRLFAYTLAYTGMRLSEARTLRADAIQLDERVLAIRTLKQRGKVLIREIPIPAALVTQYRAFQLENDELLFEQNGAAVSRIAAYRWIKELMAQAKITGPKACPKGLRHAYGARAVLAGVPLHMLQLWMGHASMQTTAIYATVLGPEQLALNDQMW